MNHTPNDASAVGRFELWFRPLSKAAVAQHFRCDAAGRVDLNALSDHDRYEYLFARALVGRDFDRPVVLDDAGSGSPRQIAAPSNAARSTQ